MIISAPRPEDRPALEHLLRECGGFTAGEVAVALSLLDQPDEYEAAVARFPSEALPSGSAEARTAKGGDEREAPVGLLIYGTDPIAQGVWEVYWIATDVRFQRAGIASALLRHMHERVRGRMVLIETSGQPAYAGQRRFYEKNGYREVSRIRDFYKPGDDLVVYRRDLVGGT